MEKESSPVTGSEMKNAAVCGLYCEACSLYIATAEDPVRLKRLATRFQSSEEEIKCYGCRSNKRSPLCMQCTFSACAANRNIDFCGECELYPCDDLKRFQTAAPHRLELWNDQACIKSVGCAKWLEEVRKRYTCPKCGILNSTYDLKCRKCGESPSCKYVAKHRWVIEQHLAENP